MKFSTLFLILLLPFISKTQIPIQNGSQIIDFDSTFVNGYDSNFILIPDVSTNSWQVGVPNKNVFQPSYLKNSLITDTINSYQANDSSVFYVKQLLESVEFNYAYDLQFQYSVDSDTLKDYLKIEVSFNNGISWFNLLEDTILNTTSFYSNYIPLGKYYFSGHSLNKFLFINLLPLATYFNLVNTDTAFYRFTFISDSINSNKDGFLLDNLTFNCFVEGLDELSKNKYIIYPNPSNEFIQICNPNFNNLNVNLYDSFGKKCFSIDSQNSIFVPLDKFENGTYFLKIQDERNIFTNKIIIEH